MSMSEFEIGMMLSLLEKIASNSSEIKQQLFEANRRLSEIQCAVVAAREEKREDAGQGGVPVSRGVEHAVKHSLEVVDDEVQAYIGSRNRAMDSSKNA